MKKITLSVCIALGLAACVVPDAGIGDNAPETEAAATSSEALDAGVDLKSMTPEESAIYWGNNWCVDLYNLGCTNTGWNWLINSCYPFVVSETNNTPDECMDERAAMMYCHANAFLIDPAPPGGGDAYLWGNTGVYYCLGGWATLGSPQRCGPEDAAYQNCI